MASQLSKRLAKEKAAKNKHTGSSLDTILDDIVTEIVEESKPVNTELITSYCTFLDKKSRKYRAAVITFDPVSLDVKLKRIGSVTRQVFLMHTNNMRALNVLIKKIKE